MAWDEWEQSKANVAGTPGTHMRLNQLADQGSASGGDLVVHQDDLGAVGHEAFILYDQLHKEADIAGASPDKAGVGSTAQSAAALKSHNFEMGGALETTVEIWSSQVKSVLQACAHISNHLDYSKKLHANDDEKISSVIQSYDGLTLPVSQLHEYFK
jgi:hypothetical protein